MRKCELQLEMECASAAITVGQYSVHSGLKQSVSQWCAWRVAMSSKWLFEHVLSVTVSFI